MRLVFSDSNGIQLLAVSLPDADVSAEIARADPKSGAVFFGSGDTSDEKPWKVSRKKLLAAGKSLAATLSHLDKPRVKQISVAMDDGSTRGPAKMMTGFTLDGVPAALERTSHGGFSLDLLIGSELEQRDLTGVSKFRLDQGTVLVEYASAKSAFAEMLNRIDTILQDVKAENVWLHIEY